MYTRIPPNTSEHAVEEAGRLALRQLDTRPDDHERLPGLCLRGIRIAGAPAAFARVLVVAGLFWSSWFVGSGCAKTLKTARVDRAGPCLVEPCEGCRFVDLAREGRPLASPTWRPGRLRAIRGDFDGDGRDDLVVAGPSRASVFYGPLDAGGPEPDATLVIAGGIEVARAGDVDGDGADELLVGVPRETPSEDLYRAGAVYVFDGPLRGDLALDQADARITPTRWNGALGASLAGGTDLNGDGLDDIVVAAPGDPMLATFPGALHVLLAPFEGERSVETAVWTFPGQDGDRAGEWIQAVGDIDGDGHADILASTRTEGNLLFLGPFTGDGPIRQAAHAHRGVGDLDGNGVADLFEASSRGLAMPAQVRLGGLPTGAPATVDVVPVWARKDVTGSAVAPATDVDGDGHADLMMVDGRVAYVVRGPIQSGRVELGTAAVVLSAGFEEPGAVLDDLVVGDFDGDGRHDLVLSLPQLEDVRRRLILVSDVANAGSAGSRCRDGLP
ncbi:MAG: FG-GAP-like repeat-containing protein [Myxococcota bacterium]